VTQLTDIERGMYALLVQANAPLVQRIQQAQQERDTNIMLFREAVASRLKSEGAPIPPDAIDIKTDTWEVIDLRIQQTPDVEATPEYEEVPIPEPRPIRTRNKTA
jgi:hypothetical protein